MLYVVYLSHTHSLILSFVMEQQPPVGHCLLITEASRSHSVRKNSLLDKCSAHRRDLYLTIRNTQKRQICLPRRDSNR